MSGYAHLNAPEGTAHNQMMCFVFILLLVRRRKIRAYSQQRCMPRQLLLPGSCLGCVPLRCSPLSSGRMQFGVEQTADPERQVAFGLGQGAGHIGPFVSESLSPGAPARRLPKPSGPLRGLTFSTNCTYRQIHDCFRGDGADAHTPLAAHDAVASRGRCEGPSDTGLSSSAHLIVEEQ